MDRQNGYLTVGNVHMGSNKLERPKYECRTVIIIHVEKRALGTKSYQKGNIAVQLHWYLST